MYKGLLVIKDQSRTIKSLLSNKWKAGHHINVITEECNGLLIFNFEFLFLVYEGTY